MTRLLKIKLTGFHFSLSPLCISALYVTDKTGCLDHGSENINLFMLQTRSWMQDARGSKVHKNNLHVYLFDKNEASIAL